MNRPISPYSHHDRPPLPHPIDREFLGVARTTRFPYFDIESQLPTYLGNFTASG